MAAPQEEFSYTLGFDDIDKSLLPADARTPGTDAFGQAVTKLIEKDYADFGGYVRIVVTDSNVEVVWRSDPKAPSPLEVVTRKLERGEDADAVRQLEHLRRQQPGNVVVLYNLGVALSNLGRLEEAENYLRQAVDIGPTHTNAVVALGVALARQQRYADAVPVLRRAVAQAPDNAWAERNLGACLLQIGQNDEAEKCLHRAVELDPGDQQSVVGLAQALETGGKFKEADGFYAKVIELDSRTPAAEVARDARSRLAQVSVRSRGPGGMRPDAVMYLMGALQKFEKMSVEEVQKVAFEIAVQGQRGLDVNDPAQRYSLKSLPGQFSGLHMVCLMYVGFQIVAPGHSIGFELAKEFKIAKAMHEERKGGGGGGV